MIYPLLAGLSSGAQGGTAYGVFNNSEDMALNLGFTGFSPYTLPNVIEIAEGIPFIDMTDWDHQALYQLKGEIVAAGVKAITGIDMPTNHKRRFQHGVANENTYSNIFPDNDMSYRKAFQSIYDQAG